MRGSLLALCLVVAVSACSGGEDTAASHTGTELPPTRQAPTAIPTETPPPIPTPPPTATPPPRISRAFGEVDMGNRDRAEIALTFDCGASGVPTPAILDALAKENVRVTFFLTGQWVTAYPDLARRIAGEHEVANHSWSHPDFRELTDAQIVAEMNRGEEAIRRITGAGTRPLWRAPYGSRDARILRAVAAAGWTYHIFWTADSGDWLDISPAEVRARVGRAARNGAIIVEHCGSTQTAAVLADIIRDLKARGFGIVTVSEVLRD